MKRVFLLAAAALAAAVSPGRAETPDPKPLASQVTDHEQRIRVIEARLGIPPAAVPERMPGPAVTAAAQVAAPSFDAPAPPPFPTARGLTYRSPATCTGPGCAAGQLVPRSVRWEPFGGRFRR